MQDNLVNHNNIIITINKEEIKTYRFIVIDIWVILWEQLGRHLFYCGMKRSVLLLLLDGRLIIKSLYTGEGYYEDNFKTLTCINHYFVLSLLSSGKDQSVQLPAFFCHKMLSSVHLTRIYLWTLPTELVLLIRLTQCVHPAGEKWEK